MSRGRPHPNRAITAPTDRKHFARRWRRLCLACRTGFGFHSFPRVYPRYRTITAALITARVEGNHLPFTISPTTPAKEVPPSLSRIAPERPRWTAMGLSSHSGKLEPLRYAKPASNRVTAQTTPQNALHFRLHSHSWRGSPAGQTNPHRRAFAASW
jgi:hypothetical protein